MESRISDHIRSNVVGYVALFVALSGTAWAANGPLAGRNTVGSADIIPGQVTRSDIGLNAVNGARVANGSLTGVDIDESTLAFSGPGPAPPTGPAGGDLIGTYPNPQIGPNAIATAQLAPDAVTSPKVGNEALTGSDVLSDSLTGTDIKESTLGQVPAALLGGFGRRSGASGCDPESAAFTTCVTVALDLPSQTRVLMIGQIRAEAEGGADTGSGFCRLGTSSTGALTETEALLHAGKSGIRFLTDNATLVGVTPLLPAGNHTFRIECDQAALGAIVYKGGGIAAVAISPG